MKKQEIIRILETGGTITKTSVMKFKRNKIVRGSFYEYSLNGVEKLTKTQFESIQHLLTVSDVPNLSSIRYILRKLK